MVEQPPKPPEDEDLPRPIGEGIEDIIDEIDERGKALDELGRRVQSSDAEIRVRNARERLMRLQREQHSGGEVSDAALTAAWTEVTEAEAALDQTQSPPPPNQ